MRGLYESRETQSDAPEKKPAIKLLDAGSRREESRGEDVSAWSGNGNYSPTEITVPSLRTMTAPLRSGISGSPS